MRTRRHGASTGSESSIGAPTLVGEDSVEALEFIDDDGRRERIGWIRGIVATFIVTLAAAAVVAACVAVFRQVGPATSASSDASAAAVISSTAPGAAPPAPAPTSTAPVAPPPPAATPSQAPTQASGRVAQGERTLSFIVATPDLHAGAPTSITVSATGPATDRVMSIAISTADGASLASGSADGCSGPAFPWSQQFSITFPQAEATQLQVQMITCNGASLVATSLVNIDP